MLGLMGRRLTRWLAFLVVSLNAMLIQQLARSPDLLMAWDYQAISAGFAEMIRT